MIDKKESRKIQNTISTLAIEDMYLSEDFIKELENIERGKKTSEELRQEVIKKYAR